MTRGAGAKLSRLDLITRVKSLSHREGLVISLYYMDDLSFAEIAIVLRISESQVWTIYADAIGHILSHAL